MQQEKYDIFISYRRSGGYAAARHLSDLLSRDGYFVSFDVHNLRNGDFDVELLKRVEECTDFILILNKGALDRTIDPNFDPQKDWLRQELAHALKLDKNVIPIMLDGFTEFPDNLPADVARVQRKNGPKYDLYYFDDFYQKLVDIFLETPKPKKSTMQTKSTSKSIMGTLMIEENYATVRIDNDLECKVFSYEKCIGTAKVGEYTSFCLPPGDHVLKFKSVDGGKEIFTKSVILEENRITRIEVKLLEKYQARKDEEHKQYLLSHPDDDFRSCFCGKDECGYKIKSTGEIVKLQKKYERVARSFNEGVAWVRSEGKYGFVDKTGREIILPEYDDVDSFSDGLVRVCKNKRWGFVDLKGSVVIPLEYSYALPFCDGLAMVQSNSRCGYINKKGEEVIPRQYSDANSFHNGLAAVNINDMWTYIDKSGKTVVSTNVQYTYVSVFCEGFARVNIGGKRYKGGEQSVEGGKWGFINKNGRGITPVKYDKIENFCGGLAKVAKVGKFGCVNTEGKEVIACEYDKVEYLRDGVVKVENAGKCGYVYVKCKNEKPSVYDEIDDFCEDLARVKLNGKWGCIDKTGSVVISCKYFFIENFCNGKAKVKEKNIFGNVKEFFIDKNGDRIKEE